MQLNLNKEKILCACLMVSGIALCVGGIFVPMLLVAGAAVLSGGLALLINIIHDKEKIAVNNPTINNFNHYGEPARPVRPKRSTIYKVKMKDENKPEPLFAYNAKKDQPEKPKEEILFQKLDPDLQDKINKLNDIISHLDVGIIDKVSKEYNEKATGQNHEHPQ